MISKEDVWKEGNLDHLMDLQQSGVSFEDTADG